MIFVLNQKSILAILLSVLILSTSLGAVMYQHYSGNMLQEVAINEPSKPCEHYTENKNNSSTDLLKAEKDDCCKSDTQKIAGDAVPQQKENNSILKTSTSFVSVIFVLVNYLFSNPLDTQSNSTF